MILHHCQNLCTQSRYPRLGTAILKTAKCVILSQMMICWFIDFYCHVKVITPERWFWSESNQLEIICSYAPWVLNVSRKPFLHIKLPLLIGKLLANPPNHRHIITWHFWGEAGKSKLTSARVKIPWWDVCLARTQTWLRLPTKRLHAARRHEMFEFYRHAKLYLL